MKRQAYILIFILSLVTGKVSGQACGISGGPVATTTICVSGSATLNITASGGSPYTYQWEYSPTGAGGWGSIVNSTPAGISYSGGTSASLTITGDGSEAIASKYYRCVVTGTPCTISTSSVAELITVISPDITTQPSSPASICINGTSGTMTVVATGGTPSLSYQWKYFNGTTWNNVSNNTPAGAIYTGGTTSSLSVTSINNAGSYDYKCAVSAAGNGCASIETNQVTVTVEANPAITTQPSDPATICSGGTSANMTVVLSGTTLLTYNWQYNTSGSTWVSVADGTPAGAIYTGGTSASLSVAGISGANTYDYRCRITRASGCGGILTTSTATVTVVNNPSLDQPGNVSICNGGTTTLTTLAHNGTGTFLYQWQYSSTSGGAYANVTDGTPAGISYTNGTTTSITITGDGSETTSPKYYKCLLSTNTPAGAGCDAITSAVTVTTVADPNITSQPTSPSPICTGGASTNMTIAAADGTPSLTYSWQYFNGSTWNAVVNSTPAGSTYSGGTTTSFSVAGISAAGSYQYRCVVSATGNGCGDATSNTVTVIVVADPNITTQPTSPTPICVGGTSTNMTIAAADGTPSLTYSWQYFNGSTWNSVVDNTPVGSTYTGSTTTSFSVTGITTAGSYLYRCVVSATGNGCGAATSNTVTVTVVADPNITTQPTSPSPICVGGSSSNMVIVASNGTPSLTYQWQYFDGITWNAVVDNTPAGSVYSGTTSTSFSVTGISVVGSYQFRSIVSASGNGCGDATSNTVTVTVVADPNITSQPTSPAPICVGGTSGSMIIAAADGTPSLTYQWQYFNGSTWNSVVNSTPAGSTYSGGTTTSFSVAGISAAGSYQYRCVVSATGNGCGDATSNTVTVTVVADPNITTQPTSPIPICVGGTSTNMTIAAADGTPSLTYSWQYFNGSTWNAVIDNTPAGSTYSGGSTTSFSVAGISAAGSYQYRCVVSATGNGCGDATSNAVTVTTVADPTISTQPAVSTSSCIGGGVSLSVTASNGTGAYSYQWYSNTINSNSGGSLLAGETSATFIAPTGTAGTIYYYCLVSAAGDGCGIANSNVGTVVVNPTPNLSGVSQTVAVCSGSTANIHLTGLLPGTTSTVSYTVDGSPHSASGVVSDVSGVANFTSVALDAANNGKILQVTGITTTSATPNCSGTFAQNTTLIVNSASVPTITGNAAPCINSTGNIYTTEVGMSGYTWTVSGGGTIFSGAGTNAITVTWNASGGQTVSANYTNTLGCTAVSATSYPVTVSPLPTPTITGPTSVCVGSAGNVYTTEVGKPTYTWTISGGGTINSGGSGNMIIVTWNAGGPQSISVNYTNSSGCSAASATVSNITVNPLPIPTITGNASACVGSVANTYFTESGMSAYSWVVSPGGSITSGTGTFSITVRWDVAAAQTVSVNYTNTNSCTASSATVKNVTVNPLPVPTITGNAVVNVGSAGNAYITESGMSAYSWTIPTGGTITSGTGTDAINVTWNTAGSHTVTVNYTNGNSCTAVSPVVKTVAVNAIPVAGSLSISGITKVGSVLTANYQYSDADGDPEGSSTIQWFRDLDGTGNTWSAIAAPSLSKTYTLTNLEFGKLVRFELTPIASSGALNGILYSSSNSAVITNPAPVTSTPTISGVLNVGEILTGHYTYSDAEGDLESGSAYQWYSSATLAGTYLPINLETNLAHIITVGEQGYFYKFHVTPKTNTGTLTGTEVSSLTGYGPANTKPSATGLNISGPIAIGFTITANFTFNDINGDTPGTSKFRWFRDGVVVPGATSNIYPVTVNDEGYKLSFEVTPVSATGYPDSGDAVLSAQTIQVPVSLALPVVSELCIEGVRSVGSILKGKYVYSYSHGTDLSIFRWVRDLTDTIPGATSTTYTLTAADISHDITFVIYPYSDLPAHKRGITAKSNSLIRTIWSTTSYSLADPSIALVSNVGSGVFSGPGVSNGVFSPSSATSVGSPHTIYGNLSIVNSSTTCSQQTSDLITVIPINAFFNSFKNVYCHDGGLDTISVANVSPTATSMTFTLTNPSAKIRLLDPKTIIIDPGRMRPGDKKDTLFFSYRDGVSLFAISHPFVVDSVGTSMTMLNIDPAYCEGGVKHYVTVEGTYPGGGTATWTGTLMADQTPTSSFLDPLLGTAGTTYPISYQYISPLGCRSTIINKSVKINPLPNSSFTLDPTYNIDGGNKNLVAVTSGGNFVGPGIIGTKFYPDIAGQGTFNIVYYMTDINNCSSSTTKTTTIRKVQGTYNNPPAIVCYRDTTYTVSVSGLPSGITILDFVNSKNSVVHVPGASTATYRIPNARAGNDTLKFSYTWDGVNYTLSKPVFIDSIGKIAITGLKDNYCDYEGTSSLRVLVENSTGNGNFSFSGPAASFNNFGSVADFFPSLTPTSATPYLVSYTHVSTVNNSGCRKKIDVPVTVNKAPTVNIIKTRTTINIEEAPVLLQGVPTNGIFSGKGVYKQGSDYVFNPLVSGLGNIGIQLAYVDTKGCSTVDKDTLIVSAATGAINGINSNSQYCIDGLSDTLKYIPVNPYLTGNFIGDGISNIATEKATFNPGLAGKGDHRIAFRYSDLNGTIFEVPAILKVDEIGQILINLTPGTVYCNSDPKVPLVPTIQGGVFSGPVTDSSLDPSKQVGNTSVGYIYTNSKTGCSSAINIPVTINAVPVISFIPAEVCIEGGKDIPFTNTTTSIDPVSIWKWEFADDATSSADKAPSHHYKSGGFQQVTLTATTVNNCHSNKSITFEVGQRPSADFYWKNECLQSNDSVQLVNSTISTSAIVSQSWSILGGAEFSTKQNAAYPKNSAGYLSIQYVVRTKYANCYDTVQKNIYIRPTISLATDNYFENFEAGRGGWVKELETDTTWSFGKPNRTAIITAASGNSAWFIHSSLTGQMIAHPVISPCFDFTFAKRPMISLNLFKRFIKNEDGAVLQYMIGDGTWQPLGTVSDDGIQWFNSAVIKGKPGLDQLGWTTLDTADTKWKTVYHKLDDLNGKKNVKFRISYGADSTFTSYDDGIAFDDIFIGERTRKVLIEHFTNSSPLSSTANGMVNTIAQNSKNDVINIQYHTNFPNPDPYYDDNPGDVSARILFYGLIRTPYSFVDGGNDGPDFANYYDYNQSSTSINTNDVIRRSLLSPGFDISLTTTVSGGVLTVSGKITALQNISSDNNLTLYLAVTEKKNSQHPVTGGDAIFYNVFRKFLPDAGGINLKKTWTKGETYILAEKTWVIEKIQKTSDIDVISYIQDNVKRDVYQAASKTEANIIVGIENLYGGKGTDFALYPNPAVNKLTISFEEPLTANADIKIYDIQGMVIRTFKAGSGSSEFTIDNIGLKGGMYMVRVTVGGKNLGFKKLIVSGD